MKFIPCFVGLLIGTFAVSFLIWGGIVWLLCWALTAIGIVSICGWTVAFSWKLVLIVAIVYTILHSIFSPTISK